MFLARVPLLMFQAVQAALLPKLSANAAEGKHDEFRNGLVRLLFIVLAIALVGVLGSLVAGKPVGKIVFHDKWTLNNGNLALLAAGAGAYIIAFTLAQGLIALRGYFAAHGRLGARRDCVRRGDAVRTPRIRPRHLHAREPRSSPAALWPRQ